MLAHVDAARAELHVHIGRSTCMAGIVELPGDVHDTFATPTFLMAKGDRARSQSRHGQALRPQVDAMLLVLPVSLRDRAMVPRGTRTGMRPKECNTREERGKEH